jgi:ATP-dependent DNA ligase
VPLPLEPPFAPQLARGRESLPTGGGWSYEPKWDGFRAIAFVASAATGPADDGPAGPGDDGGVGPGDDPGAPVGDPEGASAGGASLVLLSRGGKPLQRYFPELRFPPGRYVLDGEIVVDPAGIDGDSSPDFDALSQRIHPAASRIAKLSVEVPARYVAFDLLAVDDLSLLDRPFSARRDALERFLSDPAFGASSVALTPAVRTPEEAQDWLRDTEGVVAKELDAAYLPGERKGMVKVKRKRTIDAVVQGWRHGKEDGTVGSLILGLYDPDGELRTVGHCSSFTAKRKRELVGELAPYATGRVIAGEPSRWKSDKELEVNELRPELVVEVSFDQVSAGRIRHGTKLERWRDDKPPAECTIDQLDG